MSDVEAQYENYPYPARDPAEERRRLVEGSPSALAEIRHYVFAGRPLPAPFRALIAGGGTGDAAIQLAQHMADAGLEGEVLYLDLSRASRTVAEKRAEARGLANLRFETGSLLDAASHGTFDYIDCCGVLHHLEDPAAGLSALAQALVPGGGIGLMLYGRIGRRGVYDAQAVLRALSGADEPLAGRVALARAYLANLPATNWLALNPAVGDHRTGGDAGLVDLLLHGRDRAYGVEEMWDLIEGAGLTLSRFIPAARYDPAFYLDDPELVRRAGRLGAREAHATAEQIAGNLKVHVAYAVKPGGKGPRGPARLAPDAVPVPHRLDMAALARVLGTGRTPPVGFDGLTRPLRLPPGADEVVRLIDGRQTLGEIAKGLQGGSRADRTRQAAAVTDALIALGLCLLRSG
ncbi:class I SAM-dependent methyltransferase [Futiania mangrovi]|uniref:Class I SAM-dependent methyltransferase n=1 Tax=Futiania mangrovi TaxID=2959716 RepID=A0A9J6PHL9_9PROT|nr:class I SAM-dependent methyltransferase [Futiania mangrovii]MCP1337299.1 class I SAM-dependent methyltransferase [Futiania mangrovii]